MSSVHQDSVNRVVSLIASLQHYVAANTSSGLTDISSSLEVLTAEMLRITDGLELTKLNLLQSNFPAIDLADSKQGVAVQVTSNVTSQKLKQTVDKFSAHGLNKNYHELRIIGFCKAIKPRKLPTHVTVVGPASLLRGLANLDADQLNRLETLLRSSYDFSKLSPLRDLDCFRVVLRVLDRDALRHFTSVEGSYSDFASAMKEIKQLINAGSIPAKSIHAKPLSQYSPPFEDILTSIDHHVSSMLAEVNRSRRDAHYYLSSDQKNMIDSSKSSIIREVNDFCKSQGVPHVMKGIR